MEKFQKIVVTGFLEDNGKVLIVKRAAHETFLPGHFELPGGKVDFGEDPIQALKREFREEVSLEIEVGRPFKVFSYASENGNRHTIEILFLCKPSNKNEKIKLGKDHDDLKWIERNDISNYKISGEIEKGIIQGFNEIELTLV